MKKWIVTGATGFIGRNLVRHLARDRHVVAIVHHEDAGRQFDGMDHVNLVVCSMEDYQGLASRVPKDQYDVFCHLAWAGTAGRARADYRLQTKNAEYTCDAAMEAKKLGCRRFLAVGTITERVADKALEHHYTAENLIYGLAKHYAHQLLDIIAQKEHIDYAWAMLSNIYGGDNATGNLISYTMKEIGEGRVPTYGPCQQPFNFTYIDDVISALILLGEAEKLPQRTFFVSNGECRKLADYLKSAAALLEGRVAIGARPDDGIRYDASWFQNDALRSIGFCPRYDFEDGIRAIRGI